LHHAVFRRSSELKGHLIALEPRQAWSMDVAPNMPGASTRVNILILVEDFSKFTILRILPQLTSLEVSRVLERDVIFAFGKPKQFRTDLGSEFQLHVKALCTSHSITHITTNPHSPWRNGRAERMVRSTKGLIRKMRVEDP
jgi:transposase InsO family protein